MLSRVDRKGSKLSIFDFEITSYHKKNQKNLFWHFCNLAELCKHEGVPLSFDCEDFSCGNDCAHHCSCSVPSRQEVGCIFCYDIAMIEQIHMDNVAICSETRNKKQEISAFLKILENCINFFDIANGCANFFWHDWTDPP